MKSKSAAIVGITVCAGLSAPLLKRVMRPLGVYALAGGMLAYEALCRAGEVSAGAFTLTFKKIEKKFVRTLMKASAEEVAES